MNKIKQYQRIKKERKKLTKSSTDSFINDYKKYGYTLLEVYDNILLRELKEIIITC